MSKTLYKTFCHRTPSNGYTFHLLAKGSTNPKLAKQADELGILPFCLSLAPFNVSGAGNVCPFASPGCSAVCLNYSGRGQMSNVQRARIQKTRFFFSDRPGFLELLETDLARAQRLAEKNDKQAAVRLNVFSDLPWERLLNLDAFSRIQFYDYTKAFNRLGKTPKHYYLSFSLSETNEPEARQALNQGFNVVAPFREKPETYWDYPVIDGDKHDYRFLDDQPAVVALKPKGKAKDDQTGFVREDCAIYARVSTKNHGQDPETQLLALRDYAQARGLNVYAEYVDEGISGAQDRRPQLERMMKHARQRKFDAVLVARFDRFARSVRHLVMALDEFNSLGVDFISLSEAVDTSTPMGRMVFTVLGAVAELERSLIRERVLMGLERARKQGRRLGRPRASFDVHNAAEMRSRGLSYTAIGRKLGVSRTTVSEAIRDMQEIPPEK